VSVLLKHQVVSDGRISLREKGFEGRKCCDRVKFSNSWTCNGMPLECSLDSISKISRFSNRGPYTHSSIQGMEGSLPYCLSIT